MRLKKKLLGIILSLVLALGLMPGIGLTAHAEETAGEKVIKVTGTSGNLNSMFPCEGITFKDSWSSAGDDIIHNYSYFYPPDGYCFTKAEVTKGKNPKVFFTGRTPYGVQDTSDIETNSDGVLEIQFTVVPYEVYNVTLHTDGGTINSGNITSYTEFGYAQLPTDVTKTGYTFEGWYTNSDLSGDKVEWIYDSTGDKEYWAKWTESPTSTVTTAPTPKTLTYNGQAQELVTAGTAEGGEMQYALGTKDAATGEYSTSIPTATDAGTYYVWYKVVGDSNHLDSDAGYVTVTIATADSSDSENTDTSAKVPYDEVAISTGSVNDITGTAAATAESNPFGTKIENNSNLTTLLSLTDEEVAQGVNVWLDVQDMSASVPQTDKTLIQNTSGDYTVGLYLDINLFKKVGSNDATKVTETNGKVKASIVIPESLWKSGRTFEIIRVHDGVATAIVGTYDENTHVFTFETDKFSTYALAYKDSAVAGSTTNSTQSTSPKTGDSNDVRVWYLLLIVSLGGLGFLGLSKKKKVND